jgi:integrase
VTVKGKKRKWLGGYARTEADGRETFVIERRITPPGGKTKRYHVSTRCHTEREANEHLKRFEANPSAYSPLGVVLLEPVRMTPEMLLAFFDWQISKGVTKRHAKYTGKYLSHWLDDLNNMDLRRVSLRDHVDPALATHKGATAKRIAALKVFYKWLRTVKRLLTTPDDCTLDLAVPQARPEKRIRKKAVDQSVVATMLTGLPVRYRDVLLFAACTGWHRSEIERFIRDDRSELVELTPEAILRDGCLAVAKTWHKGKTWTATPLRTQQQVDAAKRIRERGEFPRKFNEELRRVATVLGIQYFPLGVMRHSYASWQVRGGADVKRVAVALDHKDERTTRDFYADVDVPKSDLPAIEFPDLLH